MVGLGGLRVGSGSGFFVLVGRTTGVGVAVGGRPPLVTTVDAGVPPVTWPLVGDTCKNSSAAVGVSPSVRIGRSVAVFGSADVGGTSVSVSATEGVSVGVEVA